MCAFVNLGLGEEDVKLFHWSISIQSNKTIEEFTVFAKNRTLSWKKLAVYLCFYNLIKMTQLQFDGAGMNNKINIVFKTELSVLQMNSSVT